MKGTRWFSRRPGAHATAWAGTCHRLAGLLISAKLTCAARRVSFLQLRMPLVENGPLYGTDGQASAAAYANTIIDPDVFASFRVAVFLSPVHAPHRANGDAIGYSFANIGYNCV